MTQMEQRERREVERVCMNAWDRIADLCKAIMNMYSREDRFGHNLCKQWAKEIAMQCEFIEEADKELRKENDHERKSD